MTYWPGANSFLKPILTTILWYKLAHSILGDRGDICITRLIIIIKSEISIFAIVVMFAVVVWLDHHMLAVSYIFQKAGFCACAVLWCAQIIKYIMARRSYSFVCTLYFLIIVIMQTYLKVLHFWNFCQVFFREIKSILSIICHEINVAVWIQLTNFSYDDCENTCILSHFHHQIGSTTHLPLFTLRSWNNGMRCMSFYILMQLRHCKLNCVCAHFSRK